MKTKLVTAFMAASLMVASPICALANGNNTDVIKKGTVKDRIAQYETIAMLESLTDAQKKEMDEFLSQLMFLAYLQAMKSHK